MPSELQRDWGNDAAAGAAARECVICGASLANDTDDAAWILSTPAWVVVCAQQHVCHKRCIQRWALETSNCPECRLPLKDALGELLTALPGSVAGSTQPELPDEVWAQAVDQYGKASPDERRNYINNPQNARDNPPLYLAFTYLVSQDGLGEPSDDEDDDEDSGEYFDDEDSGDEVPQGSDAVHYPGIGHYAGEWRFDLWTPWGQGTMTYESGDVYKGEWDRALKWGRGKMKYANGDVYDGMWRFDKREGGGTIWYANGDVYTGAWKDNEKTVA